MRNTLKPLIKDEAIFELEVMTKRPEQLSLEDFIQLTNTLDTQTS